MFSNLLRNIKEISIFEKGHKCIISLKIQGFIVVQKRVLIYGCNLPILDRVRIAKSTLTAPSLALFPFLTSGPDLGACLTRLLGFRRVCPRSHPSKGVG